MTTRTLALALALALLIYASSTRAAEPASAADAAKSYASQFKDRQGAKAIETYWDFDAIFAGMFGDNMKAMTPAETAEMRDLALKLFTTILASPEVSEIMSKATFDDFKEHAAGQDRTAVDFTVSSLGKTIPNTLIFEHGKSGWKVVDAGNSGKMFVAQFKTLYERGVKAGKIKLPVDMFRMVAQSLSAEAKKETK